MAVILAVGGTLSITHNDRLRSLRGPEGEPGGRAGRESREGEAGGRPEAAKGALGDPAGAVAGTPPPASHLQFSYTV